MSKGGGAGKVYFVLYLAVVLELLIIIVERDEAEEHLHKKTQEAMKIVESILSQLQSGSGTEGININPQDEITVPPTGVDVKTLLGTDIKSYRQYIVEVGVTDVSSSITKREAETDKEYHERLETLVQLANVEQIQYQIFYHPSKDPNGAPPFPDENYIKKNRINIEEFEPGQMFSEEGSEFEWEFLGLRELKLDKNKTFNELDVNNVTSSNIKPYYPNELMKIIGPDYAPNGTDTDSVFFYSHDLSQKENSFAGADLQKRAFVVNFQPPNREGWFKLRFDSKTNRILGVKGDKNLNELDDETTVNIGTVQLTVEDLKKVKKELGNTLEKYRLPTIEELVETQDVEGFTVALNEAKEKASSEDDGEEMVSKINLYGYIVKLLAPGMSGYFAQNQGSMEFDIRVILPKPQIADPVISVTDYVATFDELAAVFQMGISPYQDNNILEGRIEDATGRVAAGIRFTPLDQVAGSGVSAPVQGKERRYRAEVDKALAPGKYKAILVHKLMNKQDEKTINLDVFETGLEEQSEKRVNTILGFAYYGYPLNIAATPNSGGKIPADQFEIRIATDAPGTQTNVVRGLNATGDKGIKLTPDAKNVSLEIVWNQPLTGKTVDIFPKTTKKIQQEGPSIATGRMNLDLSGPANKVRVRVENILINPGISGTTEEARLDVNIVGEPQIAEGLPGYNFSVEPTKPDGSDGSYSFEFELQGKLERGETKLRGTVSIVLSATCTNPANGVTSDPVIQTVPITIEYEPDRTGIQGGSRGGRRR